MDQKRLLSFPLRLSPHLREQATEIARREGVSLNHFVGLAIAEKLSRMEHDLWRRQQEQEAVSSGKPFADRRGGPVRQFGTPIAVNSRPH